MIQKKQSTSKALEEEESKVQESLRRQQDIVRKLKAHAAVPTSLACVRGLKEKSFAAADCRRSFVDPRTSVPASSASRRSLQSKFELDYVSSQVIKNKAQSFNKLLQRAGTHNERGKDRHQQIPFFKDLMARYRYSGAKFSEALSQLAYLAKVSSLYKDSSQVGAVLGKEAGTLVKDQQTISRLFELTRHEPTDISRIIDYSNYENPLVNLKVIRGYYKKLSKLNWGGFKRMLLALDIPIADDTKITMDSFMKIKCYLIDCWASEKEYINFGKRFIDPFGNKVRAEDVMVLLKSMLIREGEDNTKRELLLKALVSNFVLCGIVDSKGMYCAEVFEETYSKGKMNIMSFIKILFS